jgi:hypothetical protein
MEAYLFEPDGKLHTRWSELTNCIPSKAEEIIERRLTGVSRSNEFMEFGTTRHDLFKDECLKDNKLPARFDGEIQVSHLEIVGIEKSYQLEIFENVIIHWTPDAFGKTWIADLKTTSNADNYKYHKQCIFYAWLLNHHKDCNIREYYYLCEIWDRDRIKLLGHQVIRKEITDNDFAKIEEWARTKVNFLAELLKERYGQAEECENRGRLEEVSQ